MQSIPHAPEPQKRKSFLRRLSFSKTSQAEITTMQPGKLRSVTAPVSYRAPRLDGTSRERPDQHLAGPAYEQQAPPPVVPPRRVSHHVDPSGGMAALDIRGAQSSSRHRQQIHPALASPPNSPPQLGNATTPYGNKGTNSTLPPPLQFGPVTMDVIASSSRPRVSRSGSSKAAISGADHSVSEATAYALAHRVPTSSPPIVERRVSRPLPRPPLAIGKSASGADIVLLSSSPSNHIPVIDFPRSPTLPDLVDPRQARSSSRPAILTRSSTNHSHVFRKAARRPKRLTLAYLISQPRVQSHLLPVLTVNSFLSLVGSAPIIRKAFTGEAVGRWVTKEWGIKVDQDKGRSWPNLTVWEGFLEALLHNPATYHTYPPKWHNLLQHLCLSYTLIVLHLRNLPATAFPDLPLDEETYEAVTPPTSAGVRHERLVELVMPSPLASTPLTEPPEPTLGRRGSVASLASAASVTFARKRSNSIIPSSASIKPPPSYPTPKRYGFKTGDGSRSRTSSESGRPGSVFSHQSTPSIRPSIQARHKNLLRASFASSDPSRVPSPSQSSRVEPVFDQSPPYILGRAPVLRVFVPLSDRVQRWPSAEGALWTVRELDKCGATKRLRLGDLVVNTAIRSQTTEHILMYVPFVKHLLVPLEYAKSTLGHLPSYINAFSLPPSYYQPLLSPTILFIDLAPFVTQAISALRLAYDRRDVTVSSGARVTAKRYIHVTGFEIGPTEGTSPEWQGIVSLEAEGTAEGKQEIERRLGGGDPAQAVKGPWEVVREKSLRGNVWLRLITA